MGTGTAAAAATGGLLAGVLGLVLLGASDEAQANPSAMGQLNGASIPNEWAPWVARAGALCPELPAPVIAAQIEAESGWNPKAVSPAGAVGLSQFIPTTWSAVGRDDDGNGIASPYDPGDAIMAQGRYGCQIADQLRGKVSGDLTALALAGYNAGPGAVLAAGGIPPYPETQAYVPRILGLAAKYSLGPVGAPASGEAKNVIAVANKTLRTPYAYGGGSKFGPGPGLTGGTVGWDCSSLMQYVFWQGAGIDLPRVSQEQARTGRAVPRDRMQPGDVIAFSNDNWGHIGLYIGDGKMIHAPQTGDVVKVTTIVGNPYWEGQQWSIRRYL